MNMLEHKRGLSHTSGTFDSDEAFLPIDGVIQVSAMRIIASFNKPMVGLVNGLHDSIRLLL